MLRVSQREILTQLQLKKNHRGTFCADIKVEGQTPILTTSPEKSGFHTSAFYAIQVIVCRGF